MFWQFQIFFGAGNENDVTVSKFFQAGNENEVTVTIFKLVGNGNDLTVTSVTLMWRYRYRKPKKILAFQRRYYLDSSWDFSLYKMSSVRILEELLEWSLSHLVIRNRNQTKDSLCMTQWRAHKYNKRLFTLSTTVGKSQIFQKSKHWTKMLAA
jgi:hypothetical protein